MTHTPGPWGFDEATGHIFLDDSECEKVFPRIATVDYGNTDAPQAYADGRLIAQAPTMLAALLKVKGLFQKFTDLGIFDDASAEIDSDEINSTCDAVCDVVAAIEGKA